MTEEKEPDSARTWALYRERTERLQSIEGFYAAARRAIALARAYRLEPATTGRRERECLVEVARLRGAIAELRGARGQHERPSTPGVRKVEPLVRPTSSRAGSA